jgi:hypothetical protein
MTVSHLIVFLVEIDNALLDDDPIQSDPPDHLAHEFGWDARARHSQIVELACTKTSPCVERWN